jgi:hypothetical protein
MITRQEITEALERLGQLGQTRGEKLELVLMGGALMVLVYGTRQSTRDVDAISLAPHDARMVRDLVKVVAAERGWPEDWLNDGAKGKGREAVWESVRPFLVAGSELKAQYAFLDLWENLYGDA